MTVERLGSNSLIIRDLEGDLPSIAKNLSVKLSNLVDVVPCFRSIGLYFDGAMPSEAEVIAASLGIDVERTIKTHRIPIDYSVGEDIERVCQTLNISPNELTELHTSVSYSCQAIGFMPGFAYLADLHKRLQGVPRLPSPRTRVEPGSVALTGVQTAVYPTPSPGGWNIIGRCPLLLCDLNQNYFPISVGDMVEFHSIGRNEFDILEGNLL